VSCKSYLINQIRKAVRDGALPRVFTTKDVKNWVRVYGITKHDGANFAESSISSILSNSSRKNIGSSCRNKKNAEIKSNQWSYKMLLVSIV